MDKQMDNKCQFVTMHRDGSGEQCREDAEYSLIIKSDKGITYIVWVCLDHKNPKVK